MNTTESSTLHPIAVSTSHEKAKKYDEKVEDLSFQKREEEEISPFKEEECEDDIKKENTETDGKELKFDPKESNKTEGKK